MPQRQPTRMHKLMQADMSVCLAVVALVMCVLGYLYGGLFALKATGYAFAGCFIVGMPLMLWYAWQQEMEQFRELRRVYGGRLRRIWLPFVGGPSLTFAYASARARARLIRGHGGDRRPTRIQVEITWPDAGLHLRIFPQNLLSSMGRLVGTQDIEVGSGVFDDAYVVRGNEPSAIRRLLSREVQCRIQAIPEQKNLRLRIRNGRLVVSTRHYSLTHDAAEFAKAVLHLYDAMGSETRLNNN